MKEILLKEPVAFDGRRIEKLSMRAPRVKDQLRAEKEKGSDGEREVRLLAALCDVQMELIEDLSLSDYRQLQEAFKGFLQ